MRVRRWNWCVWMCALMLGAALAGTARAQALTGTTSLIEIPVADLPPDGTITISGGFLNRKYNSYENHRTHYTPYAVSVTYLPFLELAFRFSRPVDISEDQELGDRMVMARLRLVRERGYWPSVTLGAQDFMFNEGTGRILFNALYLVASKDLRIPGLERPARLHLGYGTDAMEAYHHEFVGVFGGVAWALRSWADAVAEYDGEVASLGVRLRPVSWAQVVVALQQMDTVAAGASVSYSL